VPGRRVSSREQVFDLRLGRVKLLAEPGVRDLEPPHRRSRRLGVGFGFFSQFAPEPLDLRPGLFHWPRESEPLGIAAVGRFRHVLRPLFHQSVQGKLFGHVLEVILLTPTSRPRRAKPFPPAHRRGFPPRPAASRRRTSTHSYRGTSETNVGPNGPIGFRRSNRSTVRNAHPRVPQERRLRPSTLLLSTSFLGAKPGENVNGRDFRGQERSVANVLSPNNAADNSFLHKYLRIPKSNHSSNPSERTPKLQLGNLAIRGDQRANVSSQAGAWEPGRGNRRVGRMLTRQVP